MRRYLKILSVGGLLAIIVLLIMALTHLQAIEDWQKLRGYNPPAAITELADQDTMTAYTRHVFYVNHPQIVSGVANFRKDCPESEQTIVLGCYRSGQNGIFIYNVPNSQLYGIAQVTAAHEVLHAAYARLSSKDKAYVDGLLQDYYKHDLTDQRILGEIKLYKQTEPNNVVDEMHSVFGTEADNLPKPLENYYKRYFSNRSVIVNFSQNYQSEFASRINRVKADDQKLAAMKAQIDALEQSLNSQLTVIQSQRAQVQSSNDPGQINRYNAEVTAYNNGVADLQSQISTYNQLVDERNAIAADIASLQNSIDTRLQPKAKAQ
ncbi:MAG TPA: hypothetical protein VFP35_03385 [Candidatus Saccharimonadales bacterium]|nr:hypothetical protein [Candidatus Saccharimonadales bacterium]